MHQFKRDADMALIATHHFSSQSLLNPPDSHIAITQKRTIIPFLLFDSTVTHIVHYPDDSDKQKGFKKQIIECFPKIGERIKEIDRHIKFYQTKKPQALSMAREKIPSSCATSQLKF